MAHHPACGRCGVYRNLHPTTDCANPRRSHWWDRHAPIRHVAGLAWLALPEKVRWQVVARLHKRKPHLDWCQYVDCAYLDSKKDDYRGRWSCRCDVPLPIGITEPRPGWCYCLPVTQGA